MTVLLWKTLAYPIIRTQPRPPLPIPSHLFDSLPIPTYVLLLHLDHMSQLLLTPLVIRFVL